MGAEKLTHRWVWAMARYEHRAPNAFTAKSAMRFATHKLPPAVDARSLTTYG